MLTRSKLRQMTKVNFSFKNRIGKQMFGSITQSGDGKYSVSIFNSRMFSAAARYEAKLVASDIVASGFKHEAVTNLQAIEEGENSLVAQLTEMTQDLKEKFIEATKKSAKRMFEAAVKWNKASNIEWFDRYRIKYKEVTIPGGVGKYFTPEGAEYNRRPYYTMQAKQREYKAIVEAGYEKLEAKEVAYAIRHYETSIKKLALRLKQKGILEGFEIQKAWIGQNLEITIIHDGNITRAWTIIAEGPIQRPHYRYLVK